MQTKCIADPTLLQLMYTASQNITDQTAKLIAADRAQECGYESLEAILRILAKLPTEHLDKQLLFTGSRCYGIPKPCSDFDWVITADYSFVDALCGDPYDWICGREPICDTTVEKYGLEVPDVESYACGMSSTYAMRFGPLNLICAPKQIQWDTWLNGTLTCWTMARMTKKKGITRDRAIRTLEQRMGWEINHFAHGTDDWRIRITKPCEHMITEKEVVL